MTGFTFAALLSLSVPALAADPVREAPAAAAPARAATTTAQGSVARAPFTSDVQGNEPVDKITSLGTDQTRILFFTFIRGAGQDRAGGGHADEGTAT